MFCTYVTFMKEWNFGKKEECIIAKFCCIHLVSAAESMSLIMFWVESCGQIFESKVDWRLGTWVFVVLPHSLGKIIGGILVIALPMSMSMSWSFLISYKYLVEMEGGNLREDAPETFENRFDLHNSFLLQEQVELIMVFYWSLDYSYTGIVSELPFQALMKHI